MKQLWPRTGRTSRLALLAAVCFAVGTLAIAIPTLALPTLFGATFYYTGGDLTVDVIHNDTVYQEVLQLRSASGVLDVVDGSRVGSRVTLTERQLAELGITVGDELRFGLHVQTTGHDFAIPGNRNADGLDHATVRSSRSGIYVGFEDLFRGGDRDYNDTIFRFTGGMTTNPQWAAAKAASTTESGATSAPEPSAFYLLLPATGLLVFALRKR